MFAGEVQPKKLSTRVRSILTNPDHYEELLLSVISPWEFSKLLEKKRIGISCDQEEWFRATVLTKDTLIRQYTHVRTLW